MENLCVYQLMGFFFKKTTVHFMVKLCVNFLKYLCSMQGRGFSEEFIRQVCADVLRSESPVNRTDLQ